MTQAVLGRSVAVKGELTGLEDLTVDGRVDGSIDLSQFALTIGPNAVINARIVAKTVTVFGSVVGNIKAQDVVIRVGASVQGDLSCARLGIQEGAVFCGKVDMAPRVRTGLGKSEESATPVLAEAV
jgi:cytoskeletal protein CcmA (bactofilin family)